MGKSNTAGLQINPLSFKIKVPSSQAGSSQTGLPSVLLSPPQRSWWGIRVALAVALAQVCQSSLLNFSKLGLALESERALVLHREVWACGRCVLPLRAWLCPAEGSGAHTHLSLRHSHVLHPPSSQEPVLPTASFVRLFFPPTSFFLSFFPPFLLTHIHKTLFISHPAPSVLSASRSSVFLSYINSNPLPWKLGCRVRFQYHCFETNLLGFVMDKQMLAGAYHWHPWNPRK